MSAQGWTVRTVALMVLLSVVGAGCVTRTSTSRVIRASPPPAAHAPVLVADSVPRLLIMVAMPSELAPLLERAVIERTVAVNGRTHHLGVLGGADVVLVAGGVSMVNGTMAAQAAVDRFYLTGIVFCGIAGGPGPRAGIGDVTVPSQWAQYQEHAFLDDDGPARGERELPGFGMMRPQSVQTVQERGETDATSRRLWFPVDVEMLATARVAVSAGAPDLQRCNATGQCVEEAPEVVFDGNGVSGPTFVDHAGYRAYVWDTFGADALDMETAAVAHVAYTHGIPFLAVRGLSDLAGGERGENQMGNFFGVAAVNAAVVTETFVRAWASR